jgi:acyl-CoA dehydrogenase
MTPGDARDRLTTNIYIPTSDNEPLGVLEQALQCAEKCKEANSKIRTATKAGSITAKDHEKISEALEKGIITDTEAESLQEMESLRRRVIMVDDFPPDFS